MFIDIARFVTDNHTKQANFEYPADDGIYITIDINKPLLEQLNGDNKTFVYIKESLNENNKKVKRKHYSKIQNKKMLDKIYKSVKHIKSGNFPSTTQGNIDKSFNPFVTALPILKYKNIVEGKSKSKPVPDLLVNKVKEYLFDNVNFNLHNLNKREDLSNSEKLQITNETYEWFSSDTRNNKLKKIQEYFVENRDVFDNQFIDYLFEGLFEFDKKGKEVKTDLLKNILGETETKMFYIIFDYDNLTLEKEYKKSLEMDYNKTIINTDNGVRKNDLTSSYLTDNGHAIGIDGIKYLHNTKLIGNNYYGKALKKSNNVFGVTDKIDIPIIIDLLKYFHNNYFMFSEDNFGVVYYNNKKYYGILCNKYGEINNKTKKGYVIYINKNKKGFNIYNIIEYNPNTTNYTISYIKAEKGNDILKSINSIDMFTSELSQLYFSNKLFFSLKYLTQNPLYLPIIDMKKYLEFLGNDLSKLDSRILKKLENIISHQIMEITNFGFGNKNRPFPIYYENFINSYSFKNQLVKNIKGENKMNPKELLEKYKNKESYIESKSDMLYCLGSISMYMVSNSVTTDKLSLIQKVLKAKQTDIAIKEFLELFNKYQYMFNENKGLLIKLNSVISDIVRFNNDLSDKKINIEEHNNLFLGAIENKLMFIKLKEQGELN